MVNISSLPVIPSLAAILVSLTAIYKLFIFPLFLHPLRRIPRAHWSVAIPVLGDGWILYQRFRSRNNAVTYAAHQKHGDVVRLAYNELCVNCVDDGIKTIYAGGWEKHAWYPQLFASYGVMNMFSTIHHTPHSQKKRTMANIYSKSTLAASPQVAANSKVLLTQRVLPLIESLAMSSQPTDVHDLNNAMTMDFMSAYQYGLRHSTNFTQDVEMRQRILHVYHSRRPYEVYSAEVPWLKPLCRMLGIHLVPKVLDTANDFLQDWNMRMCQGADAYLESPTEHPGDEPVVYKQFKGGLNNLRAKDANLGKARDDVILPTTTKSHPSIIDSTTSEVYSEMLDQLGAGHETSAIALTYLYWELSKDVTLQSQLRAEVQGLSPRIVWPTPEQESDSFELPLPKDIDNLPLLNSVLLETLRLHAPIPGMEPRVSPSSASPSGNKLGEYQGIPAGVRVSSMPYTLHRNPTVFTSPETFNHRRWLDSSSSQLKEMHRWFWAFGSGGRMCIGSHLANQEMKLLVAAIYSNWETEIVNDDGIEAMDAYTTRPTSNKLILRFKHV